MNLAKFAVIGTMGTISIQRNKQKKIFVGRSILDQTTVEFYSDGKNSRRSGLSGGMANSRLLEILLRWQARSNCFRESKFILKSASFFPEFFLIFNRLLKNVFF